MNRRVFWGLVMVWSVGCGGGAAVLPAADGGPALDGGAASDGGAALDGGGSALDGGSPADGGVVAADGGVASDGGTVADGGAASDGGIAADGGSATDAGACPSGEGCVSPLNGGVGLRIVRVDPAARQVTIANTSASSVSLAGWWFCARFNYNSLPSESLAAGATRVFTMSALNATSSDVGLYSCDTFSSSSCMEDFVQYGAGGLGRESVAVSKGIWTASAFISASKALVFTGSFGASGARNTSWKPQCATCP